MKPIILYGPTGVGKTQISIKLAKKYNAEIISCDSMQIYKSLDIGTAKIKQSEMQGIRHYLIDVIEPNQNYSVYNFIYDCKEAMREISSKGKNIIIVGGTGLYIKALIENYTLGNVKTQDNNRQKLIELDNSQLINLITNSGKQLKKEDCFNRSRLLRYAEIVITKGNVKKMDESEKYLLFGLVCDRLLLYNKINERVDIMINEGLVDETKTILKKYKENIQCFKAIGYKELLPYFKGESNLNACIDLIKQHSRNYAKRQFTFMNQFKSLIKIDVTNKNYFIEMCNIIDKCQTTNIQ